MVARFTLDLITPVKLDIHVSMCITQDAQVIPVIPNVMVLVGIWYPQLENSSRIDSTASALSISNSIVELSTEVVRLETFSNEFKLEVSSGKCFC